jgi:hypothetical protein
MKAIIKINKIGSGKAKNVKFIDNDNILTG